jgi:hypothetical protein
LAREQLVQDKPQRVEIAADGDFLPRALLRRHVLRRPRADLVGPYRPGDGRETEVGDLRAASPVDHHVRRLEVAVEDPLLVRRRETHAQLS